jgi:hypothetical protein
MPWGTQLGDRPRLDGGLGNFEQFNEPYYGSYIAENMGASLSVLVGIACCVSASCFEHSAHSAPLAT